MTERISNIIIFMCLVAASIKVASADKTINQKYLNVSGHIYSSCNIPVNKCPSTQHELDIRLICMFLQTKCPDPDESYFCDVDKDTSILVEDCFPKNTCRVGKHNAIWLDLKNNRFGLHCKPCSESRVQTVPHDSGQRFTAECDTTRIHHDFKTMVEKSMFLVEVKWPRDFDVYACDPSRGFSNKYNSSLCNTNMFCKCTTEKRCSDPDKPQLRSDGGCGPPCIKSDPDYRKCLSMPTHTAIKIENEAGVSHKKLSDKSIERKEISTDSGGQNKTSGKSTGSIIAVVCLSSFTSLIVITSTMGVLCYRCRKGRDGETLVKEVEATESLMKDQEMGTSPDVDHIDVGQQEEEYHEESGSENKQGAHTNIRTTENNENKVEIGKAGSVVINFNYNCGSQSSTKNEDSQIPTSSTSPDQRMKNLSFPSDNTESVSPISSRWQSQDKIESAFSQS